MTGNKIMSEAVDLPTLINQISDDLVDEVETTSQINSWIDLHGLDRLEDPLLIVTRQAVYNLLLKSTLYETYEEEFGLDSIDSYDHPNQAFSDAKEITSDVAFDEYLLDEVVSSIDSNKLDKVTEIRTILIDEDEPAEVIGKVFENIVPQSSRRKLGQFRTPSDIAELMAHWVVREDDDTVLDAGIGAGILSTYSYRVKKQKGKDASLNHIYGIDKNRLAIVMTTTALKIEDGGEKPNISYGDFFEYTQEKVDGIISNPPYSRHHELDNEYKGKVRSEMEEIAGQKLSSLSPLYSYFLIQSSEFIKEGGRTSFITPSEFLETNYGEALKQFLLENYRIQGIVLYDREKSQFEEALTTSCITFLENKEVNEEDTISFIKVEEAIEVNDIIDSLENGQSGETEWGFVNKVRQQEMSSEDKWSNFFDPISTVNSKELTPLSDIGTVKRGIATGDNDYFCLSQDEVEEWDIEDEYLSKLIRKGSHISGYKYDQESWEENRQKGNEVWIIYHLDEWKGALRGTNIQEYLNHGVEIGADDSYLASNREPWYVVDRREPADILFTYMSREGIKFIHNETEARNLNNLHSIYLDDELENDETRALLAYLNSNISDEVVRRSGRTYSTGMDKVEPDELKQVPVIDPRNLQEETVQTLSNLFESLCESDNAEKIKEEIDSVIESYL
jgi:methylase of polypeptide subunit release factors